MKKLKVGDEVRVMDSSPLRETEGGVGWNDLMNETCGKRFSIIYVDGLIYKLDTSSVVGLNYYYHRNWITPYPNYFK